MPGSNAGSPLDLFSNLPGEDTHTEDATAGAVTFDVSKYDNEEPKQ